MLQSSRYFLRYFLLGPNFSYLFFWLPHSVQIVKAHTKGFLPPFFTQSNKFLTLRLGFQNNWRGSWKKNWNREKAGLPRMLIGNKWWDFMLQPEHGAPFTRILDWARFKCIHIHAVRHYENCYSTRRVAPTLAVIPAQSKLWALKIKQNSEQFLNRVFVR